MLDLLDVIKGPLKDFKEFMVWYGYNTINSIKHESHKNSDKYTLKYYIKYRSIHQHWDSIKTAKC
jgi:predicted nucleotide-binding protein (sugar kinase/HSP70/actin superfamily)